MSKQREALELALKALERGRPQIVGVLVQQDQDEAMQAIREALAEPARKSLSDEEIDNLELPPNGGTMRELVRVVERAHGIDGGHDCWR